MASEPRDNTAIDPDDFLGPLRAYFPKKYRDPSYGLGNIPYEIITEAYNKMMSELHVNRDMPIDMRNRIINLAYASMGYGGYFNQIQQFMTCLDQYETHAVQPNTEYSGVTFITRPRLCLQSSNLRNNRIMTALDTLCTTSMAFGIRCALDSNFGYANDNRYLNKVISSPLFDAQNPFLVPCCNALTSFSGGPDINIQTQTTEGGFQCEAQTFAIGADNLQRGNYQLQLTFRDAQHGPIMALFFYWLEYIRCVTRGIMLAYADDIDEQRLNYTVSIYRFLLDPSRRYITKYAKFTGCFPIALSIGGVFNKNSGENFVTATTNITVPFICNKVEYMDYAILMDFNQLMTRYCPSINLTTNNKPHEPDSRGYQHGTLKHPNLPKEPFGNWKGLPYITSDMHGMRLEYRRVSNNVFSESDDLIDQLMYIDLQSRMKRDSVGLFEHSTVYTPEFLTKSKRYENVDMGTFFSRVLEDRTVDSKSFNAVPIPTSTEQKVTKQ